MQTPKRAKQGQTRTPACRFPSWKSPVRIRYPARLINKGLCGFHINPLLLRYNQVTTRPGFCNKSAMTDTASPTFPVGTKVVLHELSQRHFLREALTDIRLLTGATVRFSKPGYIAFQRGVHGGPAWWSDTHFKAATI